MNRLHILIVDDDRDFAESLAEVFSFHGHAVEIADSGEAAIDRFRAAHFDVACVDVRLPGRNGVECLAEIRRFKPEVRGIVMTGYSMEQTLKQAVAEGALGVLRKPFRVEEVLSLIEDLHPVSVLVVDDDPDMLESVCEMLSARGYHTRGTSDGREAIELARGQQADVLVLDLRMPRFSGLETYLGLQASGVSPATVVITAYSHEEAAAIEQLESMDVRRVLAKPFAPDALLAEVGRLVSRGNR